MMWPMNVYEARNHGRREILVAATRQGLARFAAMLRRGAGRRWRSADRVELVVLGEGLDAASARAFVRVYCPLRASAGWRVELYDGPSAKRGASRR